MDLHQTVQVDDELEIKAYYAGHVLGQSYPHLHHQITHSRTKVISCAQSFFSLKLYEL